MSGWRRPGQPDKLFFHSCQRSQYCTVTGFSADCWCDILLVIFASTPVSSATLRKICEMNKPCVSTASEAACFRPHRYKYDECNLMAAQRDLIWFRIFLSSLSFESDQARAFHGDLQHLLQTSPTWLFFQSEGYITNTCENKHIKWPLISFFCGWSHISECILTFLCRKLVPLLKQQRKCLSAFCKSSAFFKQAM